MKQYFFLLSSISMHILIILLISIQIFYAQPTMHISKTWLPASLYINTSIMHTPPVDTAKLATRLVHSRNILKNNLKKSFAQIATDSSTKTKNIPIILKILHQAIAANQTYPETVNDMQLTGTVKIGFWLYPDGHLSNIKIIKSSHNDLIDHSALEAIAHISPVKMAGNYLSHSDFFSVEVIFG